MAESTSLTRKSLYTQVWSEAMCRLAKRYGLSDVGLAKICRKHNIPRPPRGYWAKKQFGKAPPQTPLPNPANDCKIELRELTVEENRLSPRAKEIRKMTAVEKQKEPQIQVAEILRGSHPLVSEANQQLQSAKTDEHGLISHFEGLVLNIYVSKASLRRSLLIVDALLKALEQQGYTVTAGPTVEILGIRIGFQIKESLRTQKEEPEEHDLDGRYSFGHSRFNQKKVPSGLLTIEIHANSYWTYGSRHTWRDTPKRSLETRLGQVVTGLIELAGHARERQVEEERQRQEAQERERRRQEEARLRAEKRQRFKAEQARVDSLLLEAKDWKQSRDLREYIEAKRRKHLTDGKTIEPGSDLALWLEWASQQADRLDPIAESPPSILDEDVGEEEPKPEPTRTWWSK